MTRSMREMSESQGAGVERTPGTVLSDDQRVQIREGCAAAQWHRGGRRIGRGRIQDSVAAMEGRGDEIVEGRFQRGVGAGTVRPESPIYDTVAIGDNVLADYKAWQKNERASAKQAFADVGVDTAEVPLVNPDLLNAPTALPKVSGPASDA